MVSYGFWTELATMFEPIEFLQLQLLSRYAYRVSISRVQTRWQFYLPLCALSYIEEYLSDQKRELFYREARSSQSDWVRV